MPPEIYCAYRRISDGDHATMVPRRITDCDELPHDAAFFGSDDANAASNTAFSCDDHSRYLGTYYPALKQRTVVEIISDTAFTCPNCALQEASRITVDMRRGEWRATWVAVEPGKVPEPKFLSLYQHIGLAELEVHQLIYQPKEIWQCFGLGSARNMVKPVCSKCKREGHNSRTCASRRYIQKIGIEIEGKWDNFSDVTKAANLVGATGDSDSSLRINPFLPSFTNWEFKTQPAPLSNALHQLVRLYPEATGYDCGMHVHVSFVDETIYTQLMTDDFYSYYQDRWHSWAESNNFHRWHHFMTRLIGSNKFCKPNLEITKFSTPINSVPRYSHINYQAWLVHKTIEFRMLPMFLDASLGVQAVKELVSIINDYLDREPAGDFVSASSAVEKYKTPKETIYSSVRVGASTEFVYDSSLAINPIPQPEAGF